MSNAFLRTTAGNLPPVVATSYVTDDGTAIAAGNILNVNGVDSTENNVNGILTRANPDLGDDLVVVLSNRLQGTGSTVGAVTSDIVTFALGATPATFTFEFTTSAFNAATPAGAGFKSYATLITTGAAATLIDDTDAISHNQAALVDVDVELVVSGNDAIIRVTGTAGLTVNWSVVGTYVRAI